jgi:hypothetical protein
VVAALDVLKALFDGIEKASALLGLEVVVLDSYELDLCALRQLGGLVDYQPTAPDACLECPHACILLLLAGLRRPPPGPLPRRAMKRKTTLKKLKPGTRVPKFKTRAEEEKFWLSHDFDDAMETSGDQVVGVRPGVMVDDPDVIDLTRRSTPGPTGRDSAS